MKPTSPPTEKHLLRMAMTCAARMGSCALVLSFAFIAAGQTPQPDAQQSIQQAGEAFRAGLAARQSGQLEEARSDFAKVVQLAPNIAEGHQALGAVLIELNKPAEAVPELQTAASLKPGNPDIESTLAIALAQSGQSANAIPHFEAAIHLSQQLLDATVYDSYARALAAVGKCEEALQHFQNEEQSTGPRADLDDAIGSLEAQLSQWDSAQASFERAIAEDANYLPAQIHLGILEHRRGNVPASLATLAPLTHRTPPNPEALAEYARTLAAAGQDEQAVLTLQQALSINPTEPGAAGDLAMALQRLGRQEEAIPWFQKALTAEPHNADILANLALAMTLTGKARDALPYLDRAQAESPKSPSILKDKGVAHIQLSAFDDAITDFQSALALDPNDPQLHYDLGLAYKFKDRLEEAVKELARAEQLDPMLEDPPYTLGILYMQMGKMDESVAELRKVVALRPNNGNAWSILGSTLKQKGDLDAARTALEKAIPLLPNQPSPCIVLAGVLAEQAANLFTQADAASDSAKADDLRKQAQALRMQAAAYRKEASTLSQAAVSRQRASFALNAGNQSLLRGQIAEAIARYQESIAADPTFADPHAQLALAYDRQGRKEEAAAERAKAAQLTAQH